MDQDCFDAGVAMKCSITITRKWKEGVVYFSRTFSIPFFPRPEDYICIESGNDDEETDDGGLVGWSQWDTKRNLAALQLREQLRTFSLRGLGLEIARLMKQGWRLDAYDGSESGLENTRRIFEHFRGFQDSRSNDGN